MVSKILLLVAIFTCQVLCLTEIRLNDLNVHYIKHPLIGTSFSIPPSQWGETLTNCNVIFPNGVMYSVFPTANHPNLDLMAMPHLPLFPFQGCSVVVRNVGKEYSGVYEMMATARLQPNNDVVVTRRRFILEVVESDFN